VDPSHCEVHRTSLTSGTPLSILRTSSEEWLVRAFRLQIELEAVDAIRPEPNGKFKPYYRVASLQTES
jgi:hypothetical protein